jgi:hypothetical protein
MNRKRSWSKEGKKQLRDARIRAAPSTAPTLVSTRQREKLAIELYTHVRLALKALGLKDVELRRAAKASLRLRRAPRISGPMVREIHGLGRMLTQWSREPAYLDPNGKPRILSISGREGTFEALARESLPDLPLRGIVNLACETAEVEKRPNGKIAMLGGVLVKILDSKERHLAHIVRQVDQLLTTSIHNQRMHARGRAGGRMERVTIGVLRRGEFEPFMQELRPQIYELLKHAEDSFQRREPKTARALEDAIAVSIAVYASEERDLERAGVADTVRREPKR